MGSTITKGSDKGWFWGGGFSRRCPKRPLGEYDPRGVRPRAAKLWLLFGWNAILSFSSQFHIVINNRQNLRGPNWGLFLYQRVPH